MKFRFVMCEECLTFTKHSFDENPEAKIMNVVCLECDKKITLHIESRRVKVVRELYDEYIRNQRRE